MTSPISEDFAARFPANPDQAAFWNARGEQWVAHQAALDARLAPVSEQLLALAAARPGERIVDVGCGTGATTLALAELVGATGSVLAVDISAPMLAFARRTSAKRGHKQVHFLHADAQSHRFEPEAHDLLLSRLGVMFFRDPVAAFANLLATLRPGGRLIFVCWAPLEDNPWFREPLAVGVSRLGPPEPQPPRAPGPLALAETGYIEAILSAAGFVERRTETLTIELTGAATAEEEAIFACQVGPLTRLIEARNPDPATRQAIVADVTERFRVFQGATGIRIPASLHYVSARRP
jgi:SAM-dependent methyltransferase